MKNYKAKWFLWLLLPLFVPGSGLHAQNFPALEGTVYGGALNTSMQPAAAADLPFQWDVAVVGLNAFWNNNIVNYNPRSVNSTQNKTNENVWMIPGDFRRWAGVNSDIHILNFLIGRKDKSSFGGGWNIRGYLSADRMNFIYRDTMHTITDFLKANALDKMQRGRLANQNWMEWYGTYARVLKEDNGASLKGGATLKLIKGMTGEFIEMDALQVSPLNDGSNGYYLSKASGVYGYSDNIGKLDTSNTNRQNLHYLLNGSKLSLGMDLGIAYTKKRENPIAGFSQDDPGEYDWKLTVSITDIGRLRYKYGSASEQVVSPIGNTATISRLERMADSVKDATRFKDSLSAVAVTRSPGTSFTLSLPTALRVNMDKYLAGHFYVNASIVVDASFLDFSADHKVRQMSYLAVTPRWETAHAAVYLPFYVNTHGSAMLGAAFRVGPLVAGIDDFRWLLNSSFRNGGGYVGIVIRRLWPGKGDCPRP